MAFLWPMASQSQFTQEEKGLRKIFLASFLPQAPPALCTIPAPSASFQSLKHTIHSPTTGPLHTPTSGMFAPSFCWVNTTPTHSPDSSCKLTRWVKSLIAPCTVAVTTQGIHIYIFQCDDFLSACLVLPHTVTLDGQSLMPPWHVFFQWMKNKCPILSSTAII